MTFNQWYPVFTSKDLRSKPIGIERFGKQWVLWRQSDGTAIMQPAWCPHRGASLAQGRVVGDELQCPWHGFRFDAVGHCTCAPCDGTVPQGGRLDNTSLVANEAHGLIWAWWGDGEPAQLPSFELMDDDPRCAFEAQYELPYHYSRMVETNLDIHHTPFVHGNVLRGLGHEVTEAHLEEDDRGFKFRANLGRTGERGTLPFELEYCAPTLVRIALTEKLQIVVGIAPVNDTRSWMWFRYYQRYTRIPGIRKLISWISVKLELWIIQKQDWRIFSGMHPGAMEDVNYHFVNADRPIMAYHKRRTAPNG